MVVWMLIATTSVAFGAKGMVDQAEMTEDAIVVTDDAMPMPIDPGIGWGGGYPMPYYNEIEAFFESMCTAQGDSLDCGVHTELLTSLEPRVDALLEVLKTKIIPANRIGIAQQLTMLIENKYREVRTSRAKLIVSYVWMRLQKDIIEDNIEDIEKWLGGAIDDMTTLGKIVSVVSTDTTITTVEDETITTNHNMLALDITASFASGRPVTPEAGYQVIAYFGEKGTYFLDWNKMVYASYDYVSKTWNFNTNSMRLPNDDTVSLYLTCYNCTGEPLHKQAADQRVSDVKSYAFVEETDDVAFDAALEISSYAIEMDDQDYVTVDVSYTISNVGSESLEGIQTSFYGDGYYQVSGMYAGDAYNTLERTIVSATCNGKKISQDDFLLGNIILPTDKNCTVTEKNSFGPMQMMNESLSVNVSMSVNPVMDQDRNNNNRNASKILK